MAGNDFEKQHSSQSDSSLNRSSFVNRRKIRRFFRRSVLLPFIVVVLFVGALAFFLFRNATSPTSAGVLTSNDKRIEVQKPKAQQAFNKNLNFPLKDQTGKEVSKYSYTLQSAEIRDEIIVKGQRGTAVKGRTFLIVNLKITNNYDKPIMLNVRDFVRLTVNNSDEKLAPEIHNDPVEVQAISTKYTRIGFPINDTDKNLKLQVGEVNGKKEVVQLTIQ